MIDGVPVVVADRIRIGPAARVGRVLVRDERSAPDSKPRRYFWLIDEGIQLTYEPFGWHSEWYVDVVEIQLRHGRYDITDRYVDIVVEGMGPNYRILDLDELGQALVSDAIDAGEIASALRSTQQFLDRYLHRGGTFPPPMIAELFAADHNYPIIAC